MENMSRASKKRLKKRLRVDSSSNDNKQVSNITIIPNISVLKKKKEEVMTIENTNEILPSSNEMEIACKAKASSLLSQIIEPLDNEKFYSEYWEKKPYFSNRKNQYDRFNRLFSIKRFFHIINSHSLQYDTEVIVSKNSPMTTGKTTKQGKDISVYVKDKDIRKMLKENFQIRMTSPHKYDDEMWQFISMLEMEFNTAMVCHAVLTPVAEATEASYTVNAVNSFVIQLEGNSHWDVCRPDNTDSSLPLSQWEDQIPVDDKYTQSTTTPTPTFAMELLPGDSMYIPRGWPYRCSAHNNNASSNDNNVNDISLHLLVHEHRSTTFADLLEMVVPVALQTVVRQSVLLRQSLPRDAVSFCGVAKSENDEIDTRRTALMNAMRVHLSAVVDEAVDMLDAAVDQLAKQFITERQPLPLSEEEESMITASNGNGDGGVVSAFSSVRMVRPGVARAVVEDGVVVLYHCMDNDREMFGSPLKPLEFELDDGPAIEMLLEAYPDPVAVSDLPHPSEQDEDKVSIAEALCKEGIMIVVDGLSTSKTKTKTKAMDRDRGGGNVGEDEDGKDPIRSDNDDDDDDPF